MKKSIAPLAISFSNHNSYRNLPKNNRPTYPISGTIQLAEKEIKYKLARTHGGDQRS